MSCSSWPTSSVDTVADVTVLTAMSEVAVAEEELEEEPELVELPLSLPELELEQAARPMALRLKAAPIEVLMACRRVTGLAAGEGVVAVVAARATAGVVELPAAGERTALRASVQVELPALARAVKAAWAAEEPAEAAQVLVAWVAPDALEAATEPGVVRRRALSDAAKGMPTLSAGVGVERLAVWQVELSAVEVERSVLLPAGLLTEVSERVLMAGAPVRKVTELLAGVRWVEGRAFVLYMLSDRLPFELDGRPAARVSWGPAGSSGVRACGASKVCCPFAQDSFLRKLVSRENIPSPRAAHSIARAGADSRLRLGGGTGATGLRLGVAGAQLARWAGCQAWAWRLDRHGKSSGLRRGGPSGERVR